jgi:hypothetical protein
MVGQLAPVVSVIVAHELGITDVEMVVGVGLVVGHNSTFVS